MASAGSQRMTSSDARRNYKEKVSTTNLKPQKLNVRLDPQSTFIFVTAVHLKNVVQNKASLDNGDNVRFGLK